MDGSFARLVQFLLEKVTGRFYGSVIVNFRDGKIGIVRTEQTFEVAQLPVADAAAVAMMQTGKV
jgi:hypothetical protein